MFSVRRSKQEMNLNGWGLRGLALTAACALGASLSAQAAAAESKSFALNMFTVATIQTEDNCPILFRMCTTSAS